MQSINEQAILEILNEHKTYFKSGETRDIDFRLKQLDKLKLAIKNNEALIIEAINKDLHKSEFEAYATEIGYLYDSIKYFKKNLRKWAKPKKVKTPIVHLGAKSYVYKEPYGTVLIVGPFNYPFQLVMEPLLGAIISGNCAVIKPSEFTINISKVIEKIIKETFNEKYIRVLQGGVEVTSLLINAPFDYIFFTGSVGVGKIVMEAASKNLVPVTLELGGKSPCIVDKNSNVPVAAERIVWGKLLNVGQTCVAPDYILIHKDIKEEFIQKIKENLKKFYGENPKASKDYGRIVNEKHVFRLLSLIDESRVVVGGDYDVEARYIEPTIVDNVSWDDKIMEDEIFGPILPIIEYENLEDIIDKINTRPRPLALYLFTENKEVEDKIINNINYGGGCINDTMIHVATPFLPFGGVGNSGVGSYHGINSFETFSHSKSVIKKSSKIGVSFIFPPYTKGKVNLLKKVMK